MYRSTDTLSADLYFSVFGVWLGLVRLAPPLPIQCSTPEGNHSTHYLNSFRGEPAISEFDWPFTPSHKSSRSFLTDVGSALQWVLPTCSLLMARSPGFGSNPTN